MIDFSLYPTVSVMVCADNQETLFRGTLDSVVAKTYPNLDIILCDDGYLSHDSRAEPTVGTINAIHTIRRGMEGAAARDAIARLARHDEEPHAVQRR